MAEQTKPVLPELYAQHRLVPAKAFADLKVGDRYPLPSRTIGDANFAAFQTVSLDNLRSITMPNTATRLDFRDRWRTASRYSASRRQVLAPSRMRSATR